MKKIKFVMLSVVLVCTLVGCNRNANPETEKRLFLTDVLKTMRENDSFKLEIVIKASLNGEEVNSEKASFLINNYYDDKKREAYMSSKVQEENGEEVDLKIIYLNQVTNVFANEEHGGSMFEPTEMYFDLEYLKLDKSDVDTIKVDDNKRKVTFTLNKKDPTLFNRIFASEEAEDQEVKIVKCDYEFNLNKDNTIKQVKRVIECNVEDQTIKRESEINVINYKKQKIELPA